jgi:1,2-dihydroxy-3-keto-5-methylthiopentene dioxygenase
VKDQFATNKLEPNIPVSVKELKEIGISYWKMDADSYTYPIKAVPWDPNDAIDPRLQQLRDDRGYSYADIITVHPDHLPDFDLKLKAFFEEHIHDAEEIRYVLGGSGYFDVRDLQDRWVRVHVKKGDLMTLPEGKMDSTSNITVEANMYMEEF